MIFISVLLLFVLQSSAAYIEDNYPLFEPIESSYLYPSSPEELLEGNDIQIQRRSNGNSNYLRFGRGGDRNYDKNEYDDYTEDFARPTRSGNLEKSDQFIRFGRGKQDFLRFGRDRSNHLRFGRSTEEKTQKRSKREAFTEEEYKRGASGNFLRFGRNNSNFLRFGRKEGDAVLPTVTHHDTAELLKKIKEIQQSPLIHLLNELVENARQESKKYQRGV